MNKLDIAIRMKTYEKVSRNFLMKKDTCSYSYRWEEFS